MFKSEKLACTKKYLSLKSMSLQTGTNVTGICFSCVNKILCQISPFFQLVFEK
jgi:hypothetical protein